MKTSSAPEAAAASLRFWMSRSTAGQSFHATGPVHAGRFWNGGANWRAISVHSGNSSASGFGQEELSPAKPVSRSLT
jgi:hypothetical protein